MTQFWSVVLIEIKDIFTKKKTPLVLVIEMLKILHVVICINLIKKMFLFEKIRNEKEKKFIGVLVSNSF